MKAANVRKLMQKLKTDGLIETPKYGKYVSNTDGQGQEEAF